MISASDWVNAFATEYLDGFLPAGGATVKFVTGEIGELDGTREALKQAGIERNFAVVAVDAEQTRIHLTEKLFYAIAAQIPWQDLAHAVAVRAVTESGYSPGPLGEIGFAALAEAKETTWFQVRDEIHAWLRREVFLDYRMTQEFRIAMMRMVRGHFEMAPGVHDGLGGLLVDWLTGELRLVSALREALIFQKIARHNARDTFLSLTHWLRLAGKAGLLVLIDITAYGITRRSNAEGNVYTRAATSDLYEVLRQFVDSVDDMEGCAIVVFAPADWANDEARGLKIYRALAARVSDEVRGETRDNPMGVLARVGER